ncbi:flagellar hook-associated protein 2 [Aquibacillus salsiterrae]|uniref:Flagellar hook-associated protein 2 n=1 Tax=Aquibacillus salsiterrae TaxID=2950439 RepID=A0A9X3WCK2_9BACI|nr:flagellar hook-associated protein 2 [Aquibacillus salsiterrae]MDC3416133.1 flagellar hook-associated protein 2 [Aquibacillus salsiterrae]
MVESINTSRISGLASGMDTETMVRDLMKAERAPLDKMQQEKTWMTWQRDAYRDMNKLFFDLDNQMLDMKLQKTYSPKTSSSTNSGAVTATASASAQNGTYDINVTQLASRAANYSQTGISADPANKINLNGKLIDQKFASGNITAGTQSFNFSTFDKTGSETVHTVEFTDQNTMNEVFQKIKDASGGKVRAFYDGEQDKVILERTESGDFNQSGLYYGAEIGFTSTSASFLTDTLQIAAEKQVEQPDGTFVTTRAETGGTNAKFTYNNGYQVETTNNSYTLDGITYNFTNVTNGNATISVNNDVEASMKSITEFVDQYNTLIETVNGSLREERYRTYKPLTDAQKEEMSDKEVELWEQRAKSGVLRSDSILSGGLNNMRQDWYSSVENGGQFSHLSEIGIETSSNYRDGGKLIINEDKLRQALQNNPEDVRKLFSNDVEGNGRGIINRLEDSIEKTMKNIEGRAGKSTQTLEQYTMGKRMKFLDTRINAFQDKLVQIEDRYWRQFTAMEKAIQRANQQSAYLMNQFGGM